MKVIGLEGIATDFQFRADGKLESFKVAGEEFKLDDPGRETSTYEAIRGELVKKGAAGAAELAKFDAQVEQNVKNKTYRTTEEIRKAQAVSETKIDNERKAQMNVDGSPAQKVLDKLLNQLTEKGIQYGFLAGMSAIILKGIGDARQGCYLVNSQSGARIPNVGRLSSSDNSSNCFCKNSSAYEGYCMAYCEKQQNASLQSYDKEACAVSCQCLQKSTEAGVKVLQPPERQAEFQVVQGGVWNTLSWMLGSVGYEVQRVLDDAIELVDSAAKGLGSLFSKWWVILLLIVGVLVVVLVPTLVTQLPKAKKKALSGGFTMSDIAPLYRF